jgi:hypothetical protein
MTPSLAQSRHASHPGPHNGCTYAEWYIYKHLVTKRKNMILTKTMSIASMTKQQSNNTHPWAPTMSKFHQIFYCTDEGANKRRLMGSITRTMHESMVKSKSLRYSPLSWHGRFPAWNSIRIVHNKGLFCTTSMCQIIKQKPQPWQISLETNKTIIPNLQGRGIALNFTPRSSGASELQNMLLES